MEKVRKCDTFFIFATGLLVGWFAGLIAMSDVCVGVIEEGKSKEATNE
jgi:hypothetical protein